ncbi:uncharacterized protein LOC104583690 isoform X1 [Brachypodium distachyon]|uniref:uncharacterized protein LOC104583690 isoform X1 n=1 Tax=Brachypodium distachyon TaxID=15368 RepID=UPI00052FE933|nr:uncharacterized protein LOC104583690 isoform X1 [Brachypodium distachyon]|eukprot:XP_010234964.1 uncharacterized protein LOC104583690 isoform X1 [Brachypodium distachyon]
MVAVKVAHLLPSDLSPSKRCVTVRARVVRVWEFTKNEFMHLDIVLIDEKGDKMYGEVAALHVDKFREQLTEGNVFLIKDFFVQQSKNMYKAVEGEFMIKLTPRSKVEVQQNVPADFPRYTYSLSDFQILPILIRHTDSFIDVLGIHCILRSSKGPVTQ